MNKKSKTYKIIIITTMLIFKSLEPIKRIITGIKRAKLFGEIGIHSESDISADLKVKYPKNIYIGKNVKIGPNCQIGAAAEVIINDNVTLSEGVTIETAALNTRTLDRKHTSKPIRIDEGAWIGTKSIILAGAQIGNRSIVSAGSVVKGTIPPNHIYTNGIIKKIERNESETI